MLFGNSLEAQIGRALFTQDLLRRMLDSYEQRKNSEYAANKKAEEEFWDNYNQLLDSIGKTKSELDNFYQRDDLHFLNEENRVRDAILKLEELRQVFVSQFNEIPKGDQATGWSYFAARENQDYETHIRTDFIPNALIYFKTLTTHFFSIQPIILLMETTNKITHDLYESIDERLSHFNENQDFATLEFDRKSFDSAQENFVQSRVKLYDANLQIIETWDPWLEKDIESILKNYETVSVAAYQAGEKFMKHLLQVESLLKKIWEMRKSAEIRTQANTGVSPELDVFGIIEKLLELLNKGAITQEEFSEKKAELLKKIQ